MYRIINATRHNSSRPTHAPFTARNLNYGAQNQTPRRRNQHPPHPGSKKKKNTPPHPPTGAKAGHGARGGRQGRGRLRHARAPPPRLRRRRQGGGIGIGRQPRRLPSLHPRRADAARRGCPRRHARPDRRLPRPRRRPRARRARVPRRAARPRRQPRRRRRAQRAVRQRRVGRRRHAPQGRLRRSRLPALPRPGAPGVLQGHARGGESPDQPVVRERDGGPDQGPPAAGLHQRRDAGRARERALLQGRLVPQVRPAAHAGRRLLPPRRRQRPRALHVEQRPPAAHRLPLRLQGAEAAVRGRPRAPALLHVHIPPGRARRPAGPAAQAGVRPGAAGELHDARDPGPRRRLQGAQVHHIVQDERDRAAAGPRPAPAVRAPRRRPLGDAGFGGTARRVGRLPPVLRRGERGRDGGGRGDRGRCVLRRRGGEGAGSGGGLRGRPPVHVLDQGGAQRRRGFRRPSDQSVDSMNLDVQQTQNIVAFSF